MSAAEAISYPYFGAANGAEITLPAAGAANLGADVIIGAEGATATVVCTGGFAQAGLGSDTVTLAQGEAIRVFSNGVIWNVVGTAGITLG